MHHELVSDADMLAIVSMRKRNSASSRRGGKREVTKASDILEVASKRVYKHSWNIEPCVTVTLL